jgi:hypothetical protein
MTQLLFHLHAASVIAPGLVSLDALRAVEQGAASYQPAPVQLPAPSMLPAQERRRASSAVRLVLACIEQVLHACPLPAESMRSVFATDEGTGEVCQQMLDTVTTTRQVSTMLFSNSVVNAPSGYFSIAWKNRRPATVVSLGLESFASGLLCAVTECACDELPVLLVVYDPPMTTPMNELLPVNEPTATAWIISSGAALADDVPVLGTFALSLEDPGENAPSDLPAWMPGTWRHHARCPHSGCLTARRRMFGGSRWAVACLPCDVCKGQVHDAGSFANRTSRSACG